MNLAIRTETLNLLLASLKVRRIWNDIFQTQKVNSWQPRLICPAKSESKEHGKGHGHWTKWTKLWRNQSHLIKLCSKHLITIKGKIKKNNPIPQKYIQQLVSPNNILYYKWFYSLIRLYRWLTELKRQDPTTCFLKKLSFAEKDTYILGVIGTECYQVTRSWKRDNITI